MKNSIAISVQNVSKKYKLYGSPRERFWEALHPFNKTYHREFWALRDISFDVHKGLTLGIVGRNGAGKSTLLHLISGIQQPTAGSIHVEGRISSLELGIGFNPEFTGRENLMLHGRVMGCSKDEMLDRIPEIEAFAEIGDFINYPIKTYSTGMYMRLAFAAAIDMDPDILIVDEVIAVGDAKFQQKCFKKIHSLRDRGTTILLVSHDHAMIVNQCDSAIFLNEGYTVRQGSTKEVADLYSELIHKGSIGSSNKFKNETSSHNGEIEKECKTTVSLKDEISEFMQTEINYDNCINRNSYNKNEFRYGDRQAKIIDYLLVCNGKIDPVSIMSGDSVKIYLKIKAFERIEDPVIGYAILTAESNWLNSTSSRYQNVRYGSHEVGVTRVYTFSIKIKLQAGNFFLGLGIADRDIEKDKAIESRQDIIHLEIHQDTHRFDGYVDLETKFEPVVDV